MVWSRRHRHLVIDKIFLVKCQVNCDTLNRPMDGQDEALNMTKMPGKTSQFPLQE